MSNPISGPPLNSSSMYRPDPDLQPDIQPEAIVGARPKTNSRKQAPMTATRARYRACLLCSFVQTSSEWNAMGCPNCEEILACAGSVERIKQVASLQFDGVIAMIKPEGSWVSRWQRTTSFVPGLYAARVIGRLPPDALEELERRGIPYVPRDNVAGE